MGEVFSDFPLDCVYLGEAQNKRVIAPRQSVWDSMSAAVILQFVDLLASAIMGSFCCSFWCYRHYTQWQLEMNYSISSIKLMECLMLFVGRLVFRGGLDGAFSWTVQYVPPDFPHELVPWQRQQEKAPENYLHPFPPLVLNGITRCSFLDFLICPFWEGVRFWAGPSYEFPMLRLRNCISAQFTLYVLFFISKDFFY